MDTYKNNLNSWSEKTSSNWPKMQIFRIRVDDSFATVLSCLFSDWKKPSPEMTIFERKLFLEKKLRGGRMTLLFATWTNTQPREPDDSTIRPQNFFMQLIIFLWDKEQREEDKLQFWKKKIVEGRPLISYLIIPKL